MFKNNKIMLMSTVALLAMLGIVQQAYAVTQYSKQNMITYQVPMNKSKLVRLDKGISRISKGNPKIAKIEYLPPREILIKGVSMGTTNIYVWDRDNKLSQIINIEVSHDLQSLKYKLDKLLPGEMIEVYSAQDNIVLKGQVSGLDKMQAALDIARSFLPSSRSDKKPQATPGQGSITINNNKKSSKKNQTKLINMLSVSGAQQVMLEVKVAEIDRRLARGLDVQFSVLQRSNNFSFSALNGGGSTLLSRTGLGSLFANPHSIDAAGLFLSAVTGNFIFNVTVDAAKDQDLAKILAEPTLTTLSGQEAKFISGGEFPIPVIQSGGGNNSNSITIEFKEFGVMVRFLPVVLDNGRINLNMNVSVSELSRDAAIAAGVEGNDVFFTIPSLTKREASSTLELGDGQTMSIAGLISDRLRENVNKFPGLGDLPLLGILFRSEEFLKEQTELVIFVTPRLAKPVTPDSIVLPTDTFVEPDDLDFYLLGSMESRHADELVNIEAFDSLEEHTGGIDGQFGHELNGDQ